MSPLPKAEMIPAPPVEPKHIARLPPAARRPWHTLAALSQRADQLAWLWAATVTVTLTWFFQGWGFDDPYITYRYAENLAHGHGFVYNIGEQVQSTTTPLYTLLLALLRLAGFHLPTISVMVGCASLTLGGLALWHLGRRYQSPVAGLAGLLLYPTFPLLAQTLGAETALYLALVLCGLLAYVSGRYLPAAALLALAVLTRADALLAMVAVIVHFALVRRGPIPWGALLLYAGLLLAWFGFAWAYFGTPLPVTLAAKQRQGLMTISRSFSKGLIEWVRAYWNLPLYRLELLLAGAGLIATLARQRRWLLLIGWSALYTAAYAALGVTSYFWYYGPLVAGYITLAALGVAAVQQLAARVVGPRWGLGLAAGLLLALLANQLNSLATLSTLQDSRLAIYQAAGTWLREHTPPNTSVGALEVGIIGYYAERRMIDFAGLIQPETARQLAPATTYIDTARWAIRSFQPDYLVLREDFFEQLRANDRALPVDCYEIKRFTDTRYEAPLVVYLCRP